MNWIEIDKILYGITERHDAVEDMLKEARTQFKWNNSQAEAALLPLLKRNNNNKITTDTPRNEQNARQNGSRCYN